MSLPHRLAWFKVDTRISYTEFTNYERAYRLNDVNRDILEFSCNYYTTSLRLSQRPQGLSSKISLSSSESSVPHLNFFWSSSELPAISSRLPMKYLKRKRHGSSQPVCLKRRIMVNKLTRKTKQSYVEGNRSSFWPVKKMMGLPVSSSWIVVYYKTHVISSWWS